MLRRTRFTGIDGITRAWSATGSFTTTADGRGDTNANGLPDDQELAEGDTGDIVTDAETGWVSALAFLTFDGAGDETIQAGLRLSDDGSGLSFFGQTWDIPEGAPADPDLGIFFLRLTVPSPGDATFVRLHFSDPILDEDSRIYKYDTATGWYDYTAYTTFSDDFSFFTIELVDGGYGDADGAANGVIVDPLATHTTTASVQEDPDDGDDGESGNTGDDSGDGGAPAGSSGGGGGCFLSSVM